MWGGGGGDKSHNHVLARITRSSVSSQKQKQNVEHTKDIVIIRS